MTPLLLLLLVLPTLRLNSFQGPVTIWIMVELPSWRGFLPLSELPMVPGGSLGPQTFRIGMFPFHATRQQLKFFDNSLFLSFLRQFLRLFSAIIRFVFVACWSFCKKFHQRYKKKENTAWHLSLWRELYFAAFACTGRPICPWTGLG